MTAVPVKRVRLENGMYAKKVRYEITGLVRLLLYCDKAGKIDLPASRGTGR